MNGYDIIKSSEAVHGVGSVIWLQEPVVTSPVTSGGQCGSVLGLRAAKRLSRRFRHGSEQIRGRIYLSRGKL